MKEENVKTQKKENRRSSLLQIIGDIIYICLIIPMIIITLSVEYQSIKNPDKIPDVFGYKMFMILNDYMDESIEYGDLVFTKNIDPNKLKTGDIMAFRNDLGTVTIHKILDINIAEDGVKTFTMQTLQEEGNDTRYVLENNVEGILVGKIGQVGTVIMYMQEPLVILLIILVILIVGLIIYYIAQKLDEKDRIESEIEKRVEKMEQEKTDE